MVMIKIVSSLMILCWFFTGFQPPTLVNLPRLWSNQPHHPRFLRPVKSRKLPEKKQKQSTFIGHWKLELTSASTNPSHAKKTNKTTIKIPEIIHIYVYHGRAKGQIWLSVTKQWFCGPLGQLVALPDSGFSVAQQPNQLRYFPGRQGRMGTPFF